MPDTVEVCAVELPGRGFRLGEAPARTIDEALANVRPAIEDLGRDVPVALFGHSMGGRIAWALAHAMHTPIAHIFLSASRPPDSIPRIRSNLPADEFLAELKRLGGTPREILEDREMLDMLMPIVRADLGVVECPVPSQPAPCPLTIFAATNDVEVPFETMKQWSKFAGPEYRFEIIEGSHFFLDSHRDQVLAAIRRDLNAI